MCSSSIIIWCSQKNDQSNEVAKKNLHHVAINQSASISLICPVSCHILSILNIYLVCMLKKLQNLKNLSVGPDDININSSI